MKTSLQKQRKHHEYSQREQHVFVQCSWGNCHLLFKNSDKINFYKGSVGWLGGRPIWRDGMSLSLRGTQHGCAQETR